MRRTAITVAAVGSALLALLACGAGSAWFDATRPSVNPPAPTTSSLRAGGAEIPVSAPAPHLEVNVGDTVTFTGLGPLQSIVEVDAAGKPIPYAESWLTGPPRHGTSGIYTRGEVGKVPSPDIWEVPGLSGVLLVLEWDEVETAPDVYDWSVLDRTLTLAAEHDRAVFVAWRTGVFCAPAWAWTQGATPVRTEAFSDPTPEPGKRGCGFEGRVGNPADERYLALWLEHVRAFGAHVRERGDWWQALAKVDVGGLGNVTDEWQLARGSAGTGCPDNTVAWAAAGYTPEALYAFYTASLKATAAAFPGKTVGWMLIQDGFPRIPSDIEGAAQARELMRICTTTLKTLCMPQHNGIRPGQRPNLMVIRAGKDGFLTAYQTVNDRKGVSSWRDIAGVLEVMTQESSAVALELYEEVVLRERSTFPPGELERWSDRLAQRRAAWPDPPSPTSWSTTFTTAGKRWYRLPGGSVGSVTVH